MHLLAPNTLIQNRYQIVRLVGQGGMGAVYQATDQRLKIAVALKQTLIGDTQFNAAFEREAQLLAALRHPALPRVMDHFADADGQFLVMEFVPGDDLAALLTRRGRSFPVNVVLGSADQLLRVLEYLHGQQPPIIHRDLKPQNLKLSAEYELMLLDFGLAKGVAAQTRVDGGRSLFGYTTQYAPLEQIQGASADPRSDLYAAAATLYHLLTGDPPPDALTRAAAVLTNQPDPLRPADELNPQVPAAVAALLFQTLALAPDARPQSAAALRARLARARSDPQIQATRAPAPSHPTAPPRASTEATIVVAAPPANTPPAMINIELQDFLNYMQQIEGRTLETFAQRRRFTISLTDKHLEFHISSTGNTRKLYFNQVQDFLDEYNQKKSFERQAYPNHVNGSYLLAIIRKFLDQKRLPQATRQ